MRTRNWSIRSKIIAMVAVPLAALLALWIFATALTVGPALNLMSAQTLLDTVGAPGEVLTGELQRERRLSVEFLSDPKSSAAALAAQRAATDRAAADFRRTAASDEARGAATDTLETRIRQVFSDLDGLATNRQHIDRRAVDPIGAHNLYNGMVDGTFQMYAALATFNDERIDRQIRGLTMIGRGREHLNRTDSLVAGALAAGKLSPAGRTELLQSIATSRYLLTQGVQDLPDRDRAAYRQVSNGASFNRLRELQDILVSDSRPGLAVPVPAASWQPAFDTSVQQVRAFEINAADSLAQEAIPVATKVLIRLGLAGLLGLIAVVISVVVSLRVGRSMVGRLTRLRGEALEMATERLPSVVRRLQRGEAVDVEVETPPMEYGRDEIGELGRAFNEVQRTAVQSAVEEANVRRGINEVFLNIARRSQTLLHRQLALLDRMERRETEPDELEDLYRVDHLATRMRRHAEDLVILAGAAPGRGWRNPVPVIDVVRGAISEVEDYKRVDIVSIESAAVLGRAVGDVIHLVAELLENAASFSPPRTRVQVVGQVLPNGYALEIEDRGLGMSPEGLAEANRKLLEPPDFDPADSARLGLFVVAQLANRHGIRVSLRTSGYGGVTAVVLVPGDLVTPGPGRNALPIGPSPADKSWDRPLVGTGTEDPSRPSLAELQWQGTEELRSISVAGRPVTINGTATTGPDLADLADTAVDLQRPAPPSGPSPSAVVDGLTEDGLVQRRRTRPRPAKGGPAAPPALLPPNLTSPAGLTPMELPPAGNGLTGDLPLRHGDGPTALPGPAPAPLSPRIPAPRAEPDPIVPAADAGPSGIESELFGPDPFAADLLAPGIEPAADLVPQGADESPEELDEALLPRRVRQASLAPQLRGPVAERVTAGTSRSPEQVRSLMSALQRGTSEGRLAAAALNAGKGPAKPDETSVTDKQETLGAQALSEAATVTFPAVQSPVAAGISAGYDSAPDENHENPENRPEKDA
ncbi:nitrate- and nitrite sensing domain-containing protein [Actinoplanes sp. NPDC049668]|uniref:nitrate- and nitrite sensing domain-containing protein n=1 Tax=unclassified Actinoplanes TaxID=2626549 RepID=UPI0033A81D64